MLCLEFAHQLQKAISIYARFTGQKQWNHFPQSIRCGRGCRRIAGIYIRSANDAVLSVSGEDSTLRIVHSTFLFVVCP